MRRLSAVGVAVVCAVSLAPAALGATQPSGVGNAADRNGGASIPGPHCHFVRAAAGHHFDAIITGAIHEGHTHAGNDIFQATPCPTA